MDRGIILAISIEIRIPLLSQVNCEVDISSSLGVQFGDIENWQSDREIEHYSVNRSIANGYRDTGRSGDCDVSETSAKTTLIRSNWRGEMGRTIKRFGPHLGKHMDRYKSSRPKRFRDCWPWKCFRWNPSKISDRRWSYFGRLLRKKGNGRTPGGMYAYSECGNTARFREECAVCLAKTKRYKGNGRG